MSDAEMALRGVLADKELQGLAIGSCEMCKSEMSAYMERKKDPYVWITCKYCGFVEFATPGEPVPERFRPLILLAERNGICYTIPTH